MRLIDAEQIGLTDMEIIMCDGSYKKGLEMLIDKIENAPTIDAVPVTRCKDCKWREHEWTPDRGDEYWCEFGRSADEEGNGFCSIAERKEE